MATAGDGTVDDAGGLRRWRRWGTCLSERAWGTVREDLAARDGDAWSYFPFRHAAPALPGAGTGTVPAGWCDDGRPCAWASKPCGTGRPDPQERPYTASPTRRATTARTSRTTGSTPTTCRRTRTRRWSYKYPQAAFPYDDLLRTNSAARQDDRQVSCSDALPRVARTGTSTSTVEYAKASPEEARPAHHGHQPRRPTPRHPRSSAALVPQHLALGRQEPAPTIGGRGRGRAHRATRSRRALVLPSRRRSTTPELLFCENEDEQRPAVRLAQRVGDHEGRRRPVRRPRADDAGVAASGLKVAAHVSGRCSSPAAR